MSEVVKLSWADVQIAANVGVMRRVYAMKANRGSRFHAWKPWETNIMGALSEFAVAKHLGLFWNPKVGKTTSGDVRLYEVRSTYRDPPVCIVKRKDPESSVVIFVLDRCPEFRLLGWVFARDGQREEFFQSSGTFEDCFLVPLDMLEPMDVLPEIGGTDASSKRTGTGD